MNATSMSVSGAAQPMAAGNTLVQTAAAGQAATPGGGAVTLSMPAVTDAAQTSAGQSAGEAFAALPWGSYFEGIATVCFILGGLWILLWIVRRFIPFGIPGAPQMRVESRLSVGPKKWIVIARFLDKRLIIGITDQQISLLSEMPMDAETERAHAASAPQNPFTTFLQRKGTKP